jgi:hypothetical protein
VRYRGSANTGEETYTEAGMRMAYIAPLGGPALGFTGIFLSPEFTVTGRWYDGSEAAATGNLGARQDYRLIPGIRLIGSEFLGKSITTFVYYEFDRLRSNYVGHSHNNHRAGVHVVSEF